MEAPFITVHRDQLASFHGVTILLANTTNTVDILTKAALCPLVVIDLDRRIKYHTPTVIVYTSNSKTLSLLNEYPMQIPIPIIIKDGIMYHELDESINLGTIPKRKTTIRTEIEKIHETHNKNTNLNR